MPRDDNTGPCDVETSDLVWHLDNKHGWLAVCRFFGVPELTIPNREIIIEIVNREIFGEAKRQLA